VVTVTRIDRLARSTFDLDRRRQEPRQGPWEAYRPAPCPQKAAAAERGPPAARGRGYAERIGRHLQCRARDDFTARLTARSRCVTRPRQSPGDDPDPQDVEPPGELTEKLISPTKAGSRPRVLCR
jgi:hypothetical protein